MILSDPNFFNEKKKRNKRNVEDFYSGGPRSSVNHYVFNKAKNILKMLNQFFQSSGYQPKVRNNVRRIYSIKTDEFW